MNSFDLAAAGPLIALTSTVLIVLIIEALFRRSEAVSFWLSVAGLCLTIGIAIPTLGMSGSAFYTMLEAGGFGSFFGILFCAAALSTIILSRNFLRKENSPAGDLYVLVLFATIGMMLMSSAGDLIMIFIGLELMSVSLYVLAGYFRTRREANESSLKYFLLGAFASGFLLYGIALLYGASETTNIRTIVAMFPVLTSSPYFWVGAGLLLIGLAFKVGAVPFHMWVPDVYQGSPTTISGFMATGAKAAAFSAFILVFARHQTAGPKLSNVLAILAALSMVAGNVIALSQSNLKRMLAYSSIAHAGYMLAGLAAGSTLGSTGIVFYLVTYMFVNIGAFGVISVLESDQKFVTYDDYRGLGGRKPLLAAMMAVFMFSLAGIPPFAGFFGKYYVFLAAVNANMTWLAILGVLASLVSVYYYLRLVMVMYFQDGEAAPAECPLSGYVVFVVSAAVLLYLGLYPTAILQVITSLN